MPSVADFEYNAFANKITGIIRVEVTGYRKDIQKADTPCTIWPGPTPLMPIVYWEDFGAPTPDQAGFQMEVVSTSPEDNGVIPGPGARNVSIGLTRGPEINVNQAIVLNGTIPVPIPNGPYVSVNTMSVNVSIPFGVGVRGTSNRGDIIVRAQANPSMVFNLIPAGDGIQQSILQTAFNQRTVDVISITAGMNSESPSASCVVAVAHWLGFGVKQHPFHISLSMDGTSIHTIDLKGNPIFVLRAGSRLTLEVQEVSHNGVSVYGALQWLSWQDMIRNS